jgi:membrane-associated protein
MNNYDFFTLVSWIIAHGYLLFFGAVFLEEAAASIAGGVAAALGYFNPWIVLLLLITADLAGDLICYVIGYYLTPEARVKRQSRELGLSDARFAKLEKILPDHLGRAMLLVKLSPLISVPGLMLIGSSRVSVKKYIRISLMIGLPKTAVLFAAGYFSGGAYQTLAALTGDGQYFIWILILWSLLIYFVFQRAMAKLTGEFDKK